VASPHDSGQELKSPTPQRGAIDHSVGTVLLFLASAVVDHADSTTATGVCDSGNHGINLVHRTTDP
jgi:hypothetical protein